MFTPSPPPTPFTSNWEYRQYLQKNALPIMRADQTHAIHQTGVPAVYSTSNSQCLPPKESDLEQAYLSNYHFQRSLVSPHIPSSDSDSAYQLSS